MLDNTVFSPSVRIVGISFSVENLLIFTDFYKIKGIISFDKICPWFSSKFVNSYWQDIQNSNLTCQLDLSISKLENRKFSKLTVYQKIDQNYFWKFPLPPPDFYVFFKATLQTRAAKNFRWRRWGAERSVPLCGHESEDPHRRQRNFSFFSLLFLFLPPGEILKVTLQTCDWSEVSASTSLMSYGDGRQT